MPQDTPNGSIFWHDLTVPNASEVRDFYTDVIGWKSSDHDMEEYADFNIHLPENGEVIAGVCHARDSNAGVPSQWLIYVKVASVPDCIQKAVVRGGKVIDGPRQMGKGRFCVLQDPAGAVIGLMDGGD